MDILMMFMLHIEGQGGVRFRAVPVKKSTGTAKLDGTEGVVRFQ